MCQQGVLGDEKHLVFKCPALQELRDKNKHLIKAPHGDAMILSIWQDDTIGVARFVDACLERVYISAGPPVEDQASDIALGWLEESKDSSFSSACLFWRPTP